MPPKRKATEKEKSVIKKSKIKDDENDETPKNSKKTKPTKEKIVQDFNDMDFSSEAISSDGKRWNLKITSWNVNGIRACVDKNALGYLEKENPDIICLQETKCSDDHLPEDFKEMKGYHASWLAAEQAGYSGVGLLSKAKPLNVTYGIGHEKHDKEGRVITAEYENFYLVTTYVPNAGRGLVRLDYRQEWDHDFSDYVCSLKSKKPVVICGDLNVAHQEIDIANPKTNKKNAGFTKEERENFTKLLSTGFIDTFRKLNPDKTGAYTFWTYMSNARAKNVGWRLDYFLVSQDIEANICDSLIRTEILGSDHCPTTLLVNI